MRDHDYQTRQERDDELHDKFEMSIVHDVAKAVWKVENREANLNGEDFAGTSYYDAAFDDWTEAKYGFRF